MRLCSTITNSWLNRDAYLYFFIKPQPPQHYPQVSDRSISVSDRYLTYKILLLKVD